jgi:hypothetical protein
MSELVDSLERFLAQRLPPVQVMPGTVLEVRAADQECDVARDDEGADLLGVALLNGIYPAVGAQVLVGLVENRVTDTFLIAADTVTHFQLATEQESLHTLLKDLVAEVRALKFTTNMGPTIALITDAKWAALSARIDNLLLP